MIKSWLMVGCVAVLWSTACPRSSGNAEHDNAEHDNAEHDEAIDMEVMAEPTWAVLKAMPDATRRGGPPPEYFKARKAFQNGEAAYAKKDAAAAAVAFQAVAELLPIDEASTLSEGYAAIRLIALENAALCLRQSGDSKGALEVLQYAAARDTANSAGLNALIQRFR